jgi:hypothetical protein
MSSPLNTQSIYDTMLQFFTDDDWKISQADGHRAMRMGIAGENGHWNCIASADEEKRQFVFYSLMESKAPEKRRAAVAEYVTRANYGLVLGNFEMDYSDGEVRYKTSIDVEGGVLTGPMIRTAVYANVFTMDRYLPGLMAVIYADVPAAEAIAKVEG